MARGHVPRCPGKVQACSLPPPRNRHERSASTEQFLLSKARIHPTMLLFTFALLCIGGLVALISGVWTLALAFQRHLMWGLAVLLIPLGGHLAFLFVSWREARVPFLLGLISALFMVG